MEVIIKIFIVVKKGPECHSKIKCFSVSIHNTRAPCTAISVDVALVSVFICDGGFA